jgi:cellulose synthase/poly-beta-1,6-N-acetylglucosamine synthase-like glycosyltransferase
MIVLNVALTAMAVALCVPSAVLLIECVAAAGRRREAPAVRGRRPQVTVVVPAHDEAAGIVPTLAHLRQQLALHDRLVVVADNCTDQTAERARAAGAEVMERFDHERVGKGFALSFAIDALRSAPPEVVVVVDADCRLAPGTLDELARQAVASHRPVQAEYLMRPSPGSPRSPVSALAFLVRNRVRPRGLHHLGLPCHLTGSGMAFPWAVLAQAPPTGGHLVEDMVLGVELARRGYPPLLCPSARVLSDLPRHSESALAQRERWEHGHLATLLERAPRLVLEGVRTRRGDLIALGLDLLVPPLALLVLAQGAVLAASAVAAAAGGALLPLVVALVSLGCVGAAVLVAWWSFGRRLLPWRRLAEVPAYVLWKVPLYASFLVGRRARTWRRTRRPVEEP